MNRALLPEAITGGYVREYRLDLLDKSFSLEVEVLESGALSIYVLAFLGIGRFEFTDRRSNRWERIEVAGFQIDHGPELSATEDWLVRLNFWDVAELAIECAAIRVDGELLV